MVKLMFLLFSQEPRQQMLEQKIVRKSSLFHFLVSFHACSEHINYSWPANLIQNLKIRIYCTYDCTDLDIKIIRRNHDQSAIF